MVDSIDAIPSQQPTTTATDTLSTRVIEKAVSPTTRTARVTRKEARSMEKINGIIKDGRVYVADPEYVNCREKCALLGYCNEIEGEYDRPICVIHGANAVNNFGYRYSPYLTERLNNTKTKEK